MTTLDRQLAQAFRAARATEAGGWPCCPQCFDGLDVAPGYGAVKSHVALRRYYCQACRHQFSDLTGSPLQGCDRPLAVWAYLLLGGDARRLVIDRQSSAPAQLRAAAEKLARTTFAQRWLPLLQRAELSLERLQRRARLKRRTA